MGHVLVVAGSGRGRAAGIWGPRAYPLARTLAAHLGGDAVTVAYPAGLPEPPVAPAQPVAYRDPAGLRALLGSHEVVVARALPPEERATLEGRLLALDCATWPDGSGGQAARDGASVHFWNCQLTLADYLLTAREGQRDLVLGQMMALGLLSPRVYDADPSLWSYVAVVPQGVDALPSAAKDQGDGPPPILWSGAGDPAADAGAVFDAVRRLPGEGVRIRLVALDCASFRYQPEAAAAARALARRLGLTREAADFVAGPPGSPERDQQLAAAAVAVRAFPHRDAARYRLLAEEAELVGAGLLVAATVGDAFAERVEHQPLGLASDPGEPAALAADIRRLLEDEGLRARCLQGAREMAAQLTWETVVEPLITFCARGWSSAAPRAERRLPLLRRSLGDALARRLETLRRL